MKKEDVISQISDKLANFYKSKKEAFIPGKTKIGVGAPIYNEKEVLHVLDSLLSGWISQGRNVIEFESKFASYTGKKYGIAVNSGSSANLISIASLVEGGMIKKGSEVIVPSTTFPTTVSPVIQLGLNPVFVDVEKETFNIDTNEIEKALSKDTSIIIPAHFLGIPADMDKIMNIAQKHNIIILEDCAEAHGALYKDKKVGSFGELSTFSFFVAHNMTTGEGGMITTDNKKLADYARSLRAFGRACTCAICSFGQGKDCVFDRFNFKDPILKNYDRRHIFLHLGYAVKMIEMVASFGIEQLKKLDDFNEMRRENVKFYIEHLKQYTKVIQIPKVYKDKNPCYYGFPIVVKEDAPFKRDDIIKFLENNKIETRPFFGGCLADQPAFRDKEVKIVGKLPVSRFVRDNGFFIGCHPGIGKAQRDFIVKTLAKFLRS